MGFLQEETRLNLASASKRLRRVYMPSLFQYCIIQTQQLPRTPPKAIHAYVRHLRIWGRYSPENDTPEFFSVLDQLPFITSITFDFATDGVPWFAVQQCLQRPNISSLSFTYMSPWLNPVPVSSWVEDTLPPPGAVLSPSSLTTLSYATVCWRELKERPYGARLPDTEDLIRAYAVEARGLGALVPTIMDTVQTLRIPLDTSPVDAMCEGIWPSLTNLSLRGAYGHSMPVDVIPTLLSRMPRLSSLSIEVAQPPSHSRAPIFGSGIPVGCEHLQLRSLTVAYPDPEDAIFSFVGVDLLHLSLRDWPRFYYPLRGFVLLRFVAPILSASECLRLLTRMNTPNLQSLEVVYRVDDSDADDLLLHHIVTTYTQLSRLEIHRYRAEGDDTMPPYHHISQILAPMASRSLRLLLLNLDLGHMAGPLATRRQVLRQNRALLDHPNMFECASVIITTAGVERLELMMHDGSLSFWDGYDLRDGECVMDCSSHTYQLQDCERPLGGQEWRYLHNSNWN
ncbi:hypothetical protein C2E23DRAFT_187082 [Lenzites betulinus]|nr:hypothetical protein C2E23DRAFT_187082 [Lenzites betulinus]